MTVLYLLPRHHRNLTTLQISMNFKTLLPARRYSLALELKTSAIDFFNIYVLND